MCVEEMHTRRKALLMKLLLGVLSATVLCGAEMAHTANGFSEEVGATLKTAEYIYVATRRLNGEWSTVAPVWFMYDGEAVYFTTSPSSHKAHRIHRGSPVRIWVGKKDGPFFEGEARFVRDRATVERMAEAYAQKYWIAWLGFFRPRPRRVNAGKTLVVKVTPIISESNN
jgi:PPOX class probable F420-dependent enzyme